MLTENGLQCTNRAQDNHAFKPLVAHGCDEQALAHRLTPQHPWPNGQVERMNRTCKEATGKKSYDQTRYHRKEPLDTFVMADHFAKRLNTLKGLPPYEYMCQLWPQEPERFTMNPYHHTLGLNT
jgi:hypothetical protein